MSSITANAEVTGLTAVSDPPGTWKIRGIFLRWISLERLIQVITSPITVLFALVSVLITRGITQGEFFYHIDEMSHAMNGVFFRDAFVDMAWRHPLQYVSDYYAKYPSLMFPYWPPLFHTVEGGFFLVFGVSVAASRLAILFFALMAVYFWYRIAERLGSRHLAFLSTILLMTVPLVLRLARVTMLEIPALATCLGVIHFWLKFLNTERRRDLWGLAAMTAAAFLTSQKAIFLVPLILVAMIVERRLSFLKRLDVWIAFLLSLVPVLAWYALSFHTVSFASHVAGSGASRHGFLARLDTYTYYFYELRGVLGPVLGILAVFGVLVAIWKRSFSHRFFLMWIVAGYLSFSFIHDRDPRYTIEWLPPLIYLALVGVETLLVRRSWAIIASSVFTLLFLVNAFRSERPLLGGIKDVAGFIVSQQGSDVIYFQGHLERDFIFFVRKYDPRKERMVLKQKELADMLALADPPQTLGTEDAILEWFRTVGIRYAAIQVGDEWENAGEKAAHIPMRNLLESGKFELVNTFPVKTNQPDIQAREIKVYRYRGELHRVQKILIPVDTIGHGIPIDLSRLVGRPWPN